MQTIKTDLLEVAYEAGGPRGGPPILLLHGWPDDIREWSAITGHLEKAGFYWVAPWVRGFGATRFLSSGTLRDGSGMALAQDAIDIADALGFERFSVIGAHCVHFGRALAGAVCEHYGAVVVVLSRRALRDAHLRAVPTLVVSVVHVD
jgi:pimeloyl-ACP methyl ester carboxylesterase